MASRGAPWSLKTLAILVVELALFCEHAFGVFLDGGVAAEANESKLTPFQDHRSAGDPGMLRSGLSYGDDSEPSGFPLLAATPISLLDPSEISFVKAKGGNQVAEKSAAAAKEETPPSSQSAPSPRHKHPSLVQMKVARRSDNRHDAQSEVTETDAQLGNQKVAEMERAELGQLSAMERVDMAVNALEARNRIAEEMLRTEHAEIVDLKRKLADIRNRAVATEKHRDARMKDVREATLSLITEAKRKQKEAEDTLKLALARFDAGTSMTNHLFHEEFFGTVENLDTMAKNQSTAASTNNVLS
eukprot:TRINITY_DN11566_c1_g2_i2.p1 TRINITY_DN11566_c1_g2~~TRINITY_DN11566_c1_g2_i2.p1  ORF type:complete len:302 (+),score=64.89 TRINITY_DN11566_c1_g2_i2:61-966(+)